MIDAPALCRVGSWIDLDLSSREEMQAFLKKGMAGLLPIRPLLQPTQHPAVRFLIVSV
jgi:hypothetical protein